MAASVIEDLKAYRARLLAAGRTLEARAVGRCIILLRNNEKLCQERLEDLAKNSAKKAGST